MARRKDISGSREGLLRSKGAIPLRRSLEEAYRSSSEDEELDELELLQEGGTSQHKSRTRYRDEANGLNSSTLPYETATDMQGQTGSPLRRIGRFFRPRRTCLIITFIMLAGLITLLTGSGYWVYKNAPADGVSW